MKIAFVSVRYGTSIVGGAEQACRQLATHIASVPGVSASVYTTCATGTDWVDDQTPGVSVEDGVSVHRYRSVSGRDPAFARASREVLGSPQEQTLTASMEWLRLQGPVCPDATDAAIASDADLIVCMPYLYWPAIEIARRGPDRFVLHPAAHDEAPIHLPLFTSTFAAARGLAFFTDSERRLVERLWPDLAATPQVVSGLGIDLREPVAPSLFRAASAVGERPYVLCLGRVNDGKGTGLLARFFRAYKEHHPGPLALVFAGTVDNHPEPHPDIVVTGALTDELKWSALSGASVFVNPSANESFSIVLLEAWSVGRPALVNAHCAATVEHVRRSGGGLAFGSFATFSMCLDRLLHDTSVSVAAGTAGQAYVQHGFSWPTVISRYHRWLERLY